MKADLQAVTPYFTYLRYGYIAALFLHIGFGVVFTLYSIDQLSIFNIFSVLTYIGALWLLSRGYVTLSLIVVTLEVVLHAFAAVAVIGWGSGFHYYLFALTSIASFHPTWRFQTKMVHVFFVISSYIAMHNYTLSHPTLQVADEMFLFSWKWFNIAFSFAFVALMAHIFARLSYESESKLNALASNDPLTGLNNRREFLKLFDQELVKYKRNKRPMALLVADVDNFKRFNDSYGHECGDKALVTLATCFRSSMREQDHIARWGGEEFLVLLPETDLNGAKILAGKLQSAVEHSDFHCDSQSKNMTITVGYGVYVEGETVEHFITRVDKALLEGKRSGKNTIIEADPLG